MGAEVDWVDAFRILKAARIDHMTDSLYSSFMTSFSSHCKWYKHS